MNYENRKDNGEDLHIDETPHQVARAIVNGGELRETQKAQHCKAEKVGLISTSISD